MSNDLMIYQLSTRNHEKAVFDSKYYTFDQLEKFYKNASLGFLFSTLASWFLSAFFIGQFFAGSEFEYLADWRFMQFIYAVMGILLATALTLAEMVLFNSGKVREYWLVALFSICFSVFAETSATMQREQVAVQTKSTHSQAYQATLKAANTLSSTTALSASQVQLSYAQNDLDAAKRSRNPEAIGQAQDRVNRLQKQSDLEQANRTALLATTLQQAKAMEYDETKHQAIIRFMAETLSLSHVQASATLAFFLILTFKLCFHYLGTTKQRTERAIGIQQGTISPVLELPSLDHSTVHTVKLQSDSGTINQSLNSQNTVHIQPNSDLYQRFTHDLAQQQVELSARGIKEWVKVNASGLELYDLQATGDQLLSRACDDHYIRLNSDYTPTNRKPKYVYV